MAEEPHLVPLPGDSLYVGDCYLQTFTLNDARSLFAISKTADTANLFKLINNRTNLDAENLTIQDLWFIFYWQRINSYPNHPMRTPRECPHCNHNNSSTLSAGKLVIKDLDSEYEHGVEFNFPSAINEDGSPLHVPIRLQLVGDEITASKFIKNTLEVAKPSRELVQEVILACMLEPMGGPLSERYGWVKKNLTSADDAMALKAFEDHFDYGVMNHANFECEDCPEDTKVRFPFDLVNFFPTIRDSRDIQSRILSRKASQPTDTESGGGGPSEASVYTEDARKRPEGAETKKGPSSSENEKVEISNIDDVVDGR